MKRLSFSQCLVVILFAGVFLLRPPNSIYIQSEHKWSRHCFYKTSFKWILWVRPFYESHFCWKLDCFLLGLVGCFRSICRGCCDPIIKGRTWRSIVGMQPFGTIVVHCFIWFFGNFSLYQTTFQVIWMSITLMKWKSYTRSHLLPCLKKTITSINIDYWFILCCLYHPHLFLATTIWLLLLYVSCQ